MSGAVATLAPSRSHSETLLDKLEKNTAGAIETHRKFIAELEEALEAIRLAKTLLGNRAGRP